MTPRPTVGALVFVALALVACADDVGNAIAGSVSPSAPTGAAALPLVGTGWRLTTFAAGDVVFSVIGGTDITAAFAGDGMMAGSAGCNGFTAAYVADGSAMSFSSLSTTTMHCGGPLKAQESAFLDAMRRVASFAIEGPQLLLLDENGAQLLSFEGSAS